VCVRVSACQRARVIANAHLRRFSLHVSKSLVDTETLCSARADASSSAGVETVAGEAGAGRGAAGAGDDDVRGRGEAAKGSGAATERGGGVADCDGGVRGLWRASAPRELAEEPLASISNPSQPSWAWP